MLPPGWSGATQADRPRRLAAMNGRTSASGRVLSTCCGSTQPRRAVPTPKRICRASAGARWQSLSMASVTPAAAAARARVAVEIHVAGRAVDFERGPGLGRRRVERVEVQGVAVEMSDELVGRMAEDVDERMADRREAPARQPVGVLAARDRGAMPARCRSCSRMASSKSSRPSGRMSTSMPCRIVIPGNCSRSRRSRRAAARCRRARAFATRPRLPSGR